jgi:hypothetical protein
LPPHIKELLDNWPTRGSTGDRARHRHILSIANGLRHYVSAEEAVELIRAKMPRPPKGREVEQTVARAYKIETVPKTDVPPPHRVDIGLIEDIVAERIGARKNALAELEEKSPAPIPGATAEILYQLFNPEDLICVAGADYHRAVTRALKQFCFGNGSSSELIVANPMLEPYTLDAAGKRHYRTLANTGPRRFMVCDFDLKGSDFEPLISLWAKYGVTVQDAAAALIDYLADYGPLALVTYSGNVSLQAWFYCQGESESKNSKMRAFFESAVIIGADRAGWTRCQFFRLPLATRANTGRLQSVHYFNPETVSLEVELDEED